MINGKTWVISDTHFGSAKGHTAIGLEWRYKPKAYCEFLTSNWNSVVQPTDTILHLGDVGTTSHHEKPLASYLRTLNGHKYLILGNHDTLPLSYYRNCGFTVLPPFYANVEAHGIVFSHKPIMKISKYGLFNIHGHKHHVLKVGARYINMTCEKWHYTPCRIKDILARNKEEPWQIPLL